MTAGSTMSTPSTSKMRKSRVMIGMAPLALLAVVLRQPEDVGHEDITVRTLVNGLFTPRGRPIARTACRWGTCSSTCTPSRARSSTRRPSWPSSTRPTTIDDSKAYTAPFTVGVTQRIMVDQELIEFICNEYNRAIEHIAR